MKTVKKILKGVGITFVILIVIGMLVDKDEGRSDYRSMYSRSTNQNTNLALGTNQSLRVVEDLKKRTPGWEDVHETILQTYSIDGLNKSQALVCNGHLSVIAANVATRKTRQDIARDCPYLSQVLAKSGM